MSQVMNASANKQMIMIGAVVGIVDIIGSTKISNETDVFTEWELKKRFFDRAAILADELGILMLNHTGDGFIFIANQEDKAGWADRLTAFHKALAADYRAIFASLKEQIGNVETGLRLGVTTGTILLGRITEHELSPTAIGPSVNLAARLAALGQAGEMVVAEDVWTEMQPALTANYDAETKSYKELKGFNETVLAAHVK